MAHGSPSAYFSVRRISKGTSLLYLGSVFVPPGPPPGLPPLEPPPQEPMVRVRNPPILRRVVIMIRLQLIPRFITHYEHRVVTVTVVPDLEWFSPWWFVISGRASLVR